MSADEHKLIIDLNLSKRSSGMLSSGFKEKSSLCKHKGYALP